MFDNGEDSCRYDAGTKWMRIPMRVVGGDAFKYIPARADMDLEISHAMDGGAGMGTYLSRPIVIPVWKVKTT